MLVPAVKGETKTLAVEIPDEVKDLFNIASNMEGVVPRLPQIGIIHRGQMFIMPDESKVDKFEGVIIDQHPANAWWEKEMSTTGAGAMPDCFSLDGITPDINQPRVQSQKCVTCKQNQFGSDAKTGKGKACKNMKRLHIIMEGSLLPRRLTIPPTSIKSFEKYMAGLIDRGLPYSCVVSLFSLGKKTSEGFEYSEIQLVKDRVLNKAELITVAGFIKQYKDSARVQEIRSDEYIGESNSKNDVFEEVYKDEIKNNKLPGSDIPF